VQRSILADGGRCRVAGPAPAPGRRTAVPPGDPGDTAVGGGAQYQFFAFECDQAPHGEP
jgi:hypothetical protein